MSTQEADTSFATRVTKTLSDIPELTFEQILTPQHIKQSKTKKGEAMFNELSAVKKNNDSNNKDKSDSDSSTEEKLEADSDNSSDNLDLEPYEEQPSNDKISIKDNILMIDSIMTINEFLTYLLITKGLPYRIKHLKGRGWSSDAQSLKVHAGSKIYRVYITSTNEQKIDALKDKFTNVIWIVKNGAGKLFMKSGKEIFTNETDSAFSMAIQTRLLLKKDVANDIKYINRVLHDMKPTSETIVKLGFTLRVLNIVQEMVNANISINKADSLRKTEGEILRWVYGQCNALNKEGQDVPGIPKSRLRKEGKTRQFKPKDKALKKKK
jgi:hypothetical protein